MCGDDRVRYAGLLQLMLRRLSASFRKYPNAWLFALGACLILLPGLHRIAVVSAYRGWIGSSTTIERVLEAEHLIVASEWYERSIIIAVVIGSLIAGFARWRAL